MSRSEYTPLHILLEEQKVGEEGPRKLIIELELQNLRKYI